MHFLHQRILKIQLFSCRRSGNIFKTLPRDLMLPQSRMQQLWDKVQTSCPGPQDPSQPALTHRPTEPHPSAPALCLLSGFFCWKSPSFSQVGFVFISSAAASQHLRVLVYYFSYRTTIIGLPVNPVMPSSLNPSDQFPSRAGVLCKALAEASARTQRWEGKAINGTL